MFTKTQVLIIGAGPTGLSMATQLVRYNIDFIILEKNKQTTHLSKAVVIQARTLEIFREINIDQKAIEEGRMTTAMNMFYKGKQRVYLDLDGMGEGLSHFTFALSLEQSKTEQLLVRTLAEKEKKINWGCEFIRFEQHNGVTAYYKDADGQEKIIEANYIVGCDGAGSMVRHQMGASFEGDTLPKIFYVADVALKSPVINKDELFIFLIKKGFVLFFPMEGKEHYRVIGILPDKTEDDEFTFDEIEAPIREQMMIDVDFKEVRWFSTYKVHSRKADQFMNDRSFICGDAAHIHTPAGGQGMNTGIQDAYNLAWKIAHTINFQATPALLKSYNTERMENASHLLKTTDRMFDFMTGSNSLLNFFRLHIFPVIARFISKNPNINKKFFPLLSQIGIAYPNSILTLKSNIGKIKAGDRMPYFICDDGKDIFDHIKASSFKILFFGNDDTDTFISFKELKLPIVSFTIKKIPKEIFQDATNFYILLRPDNHISYIGKDTESCKNLLNNLYSDEIRTPV